MTFRSYAYDILCVSAKLVLPLVGVRSVFRLGSTLIVGSSARSSSISASVNGIFHEKQKQEKKEAKGQKNMGIASGNENGDCAAVEVEKSVQPPATAVAKAAAYTKADCELNPWPEFCQHRLDLWSKYMQRYKEELSRKVPDDIEITLPDGKKVLGQSWRTTPHQVARGISQGLADQAITCKVDDEMWDLDRPLEKSCNIKFLKFGDGDDAKEVFWHSSAHLLGEAAERYFGGSLCYGPPLDSGFYYDMHIDRSVIAEDLPNLESIINCIVKDKQRFERLELSKEELLELFKYNKFKLRLIKEKVNTPTATVYRCGSLIDMCRGPHVPHSGKIKAFKVLKSSSTYWEGNAEMESLQRVYGISFPDIKQLKEWIKLQEEAAARDHRRIGRDQELFMFHELSPGSAFFYPRGTYIYNTLMEFIRRQYRRRGFTEVITPNMFNSKLWETSGHWQHYAKNMFKIEVDTEQFGLKPMNCPGHCLMFDSRPRTFRELPIRFADFGVLHRNELSGALSGLTRVRRFQQDDAHIFCRHDQIKSEIYGCLDFVKFVFETLGFGLKLFLSTRPDDFIGEIEMWNNAEEELKNALNDFGAQWTLNPGDGAFYGPKVDVVVSDAMKRDHQCATIQLDFQLPIRFNLHYTDESGARKQPIIIHRAILGSMERMMAVLTENYGGKWPFWLSPRQAVVIPVHTSLNDYATGVKNKIFDAGFECDVDVDTGDTLNKKIRNAQLAQYNFILVVGENEFKRNTVNVRTRDNKVRGEIAVDDLIVRFRRLKEEYVQNSEEEL